VAGKPEITAAENLSKSMTHDFEDFAYPPSGGRMKMVVLGIMLPGIITYFGTRAWWLEEAIWPGRGNSSIVVHGECARAMAVVYLSVAAFIHFRWFWGLIPADRTFQAGAVCSLFTFLGALIYALCVL
jgi:hypothetical protein